MSEQMTSMPDWFWLFATALLALGVCMCLRSLALYRQREIDQHDLAREVASLRLDYEMRMKSKNDVESVNAREVR